MTTNPWGGAEQTISVGGDKIFTVEAMEAPAGGNAWDVAAFPSVFRGASYGGDRTTDSGMPVQISAIDSVRTGMKTNASAITYKGNTTYDVYFTAAEDAAPVRMHGTPMAAAPSALATTQPTATAVLPQ